MYGRPQFKDFSRVKTKFNSNSKEVRVLRSKDLMALNYSAHVKGAFK